MVLRSNPKKNKQKARTARQLSATRVPPVFITPMAAQVVKQLPGCPDWLYELKFDGYRALLLKNGQHIELRSRKNKDLAGMYPAITKQPLRPLAAVGAHRPAKPTACPTSAAAGSLGPVAVP
jgi:ATP-dependent DNA ligase